jgi:coenzyme F420-dependent glucose-6-phosphate dehydrogenase
VTASCIRSPTGGRRSGSPRSGRRPPRSPVVAATGCGRSPDPETTPELIDAWREAGGDGEIVFQALVSWAPSDEEAVEQARKWKGAQPQGHFTADWHEPRKMYEHGEQETSDEEFAQNIIAASDPDEIVERLRELEKLGATTIVLQNNSGGNVERAIEVLGEQVLPALRGARV